jgi:hypothetical protein
MNTPQTPQLRQEMQQLIPDTTLITEPLIIPIEWMRYCEPCDGEQLFVARWRCPAGLIAQCTKCGDQRLARWNRTHSDGWEAYT